MSAVQHSTESAASAGAFIYAIQLGRGVYKIGYSKNQPNRVKSGQTFYSEKLKTVCCVPVADPRAAERQCLRLLGSNGRAAGHEVVHKSEADVIKAIHLVTGREVLSSAQVAARLWRTSYKGRTVGDWAASVWDIAEENVMAAYNSDGAQALGELGFTPFLSEAYYLHLHQPKLLLKALPEFAFWTGIIERWEGLDCTGRPIDNEKRTTVRLSVVK